MATSAAVIVGVSNWGFTAAFWGIVIAIVLHALNNAIAEAEEYSQDKFQFSPMGELNALLNKKGK